MLLQQPHGKRFCGIMASGDEVTDVAQISLAIAAVLACNVVHVVASVGGTPSVTPVNVAPPAHMHAILLKLWHLVMFLMGYQ